MNVCTKCGFESVLPLGDSCPGCFKKKYSKPAVKSQKFPTIAELAKELRDLNANIEGECDVRLQVYTTGRWVVRFGLPDYDNDHFGYWGVGIIPGVVNGKAVRFDSRALAKELLEQAKDQFALGVQS